MRRYRIVHSTSMAYDAPVRASHNELRMTPVTETGQTTLENRLRVRPMTWSHVYRDHWGTHVTSMESLLEHHRLDIEAISTVERTQGEPPVDSVGWEALTDDAVADRSYEFLMLTPRTQPGEGVAELAESVRGLATPRAAAYRLCERMNEEMTYQHGITGVHSNGEEAWRERVGVCQDFAHITLGALRMLGVPARYVSGYLAPKADSEVGETSTGESHAWVEFWDGQWLPADPTNLTPVGLDHVVVARGRDYQDVPPFKGVYSGPGVAALDVEVRFTRLS
jgi:transglutaminase-like putative cysteine protease